MLMQYYANLILTVFSKFMRFHFVVHDEGAHGLVGVVGSDTNKPLNVQLILHLDEFLLMDVVRTKNKYKFKLANTFNKIMIKWPRVAGSCLKVWLV